MTPRLSTPLVRAASIAALVVFASGCSLLSTTTETVADGLDATTDTTDATSDSTTDSFRDDDMEARAAAFVRTDLAAIRADAARGHGETLDTLAYLLDEPDANAFSHWMQAHYAQLFVGLERPEELLARIQRYRGATRTASVAGS